MERRRDLVTHVPFDASDVTNKEGASWKHCSGTQQYIDITAPTESRCIWAYVKVTISHFLVD